MPNLLNSILKMLPQLIILFFSIIFHEVMHGAAALRCGDTTARDSGRLTLNPLPHIDLFGSFILPLLLIFMRFPILFGWAKPVPINPMRFGKIKKDLALVGAAGPASNFVLAVVFAVFFRIATRTGESTGFLAEILAYGVGINLVLAFFNLLPIPPLDGSRIVLNFLPDRIADKYIQIERYGFIIIFILLMLNIFDWLIWPFVRVFLNILIGHQGLYFWQG
jgi:Zn-dependent protease